MLFTLRFSLHKLNVLVDMLLSTFYLLFEHYTTTYLPCPSMSPPFSSQRVFNIRPHNLQCLALSVRISSPSAHTRISQHNHG